MTQTATLSGNDIAIAKSLVPALKEHGKEITTIFYATLFRDYPELLNIFNHNNQRAGLQQEALATAVYEAVANLDHLENILPVVKHIAHKHCSLGVQPEHYPIVGEYLTMAVQQVLGEQATPEILSIWKRAYNVIADAFIQLEQEIYRQGAEQSGGWSGFKRFVVKRKEQEGEGLIALYLEPEDGEALPAYEPGQYVCVRAQIGKFHHLRQYSLTEAPGKKHFRIGVKCEGQEGSHAGKVSSYLHEQASQGDVLELSCPGGVFTLDHTSSRPVVLLGAGIGITPLLSMLYTLRERQPERTVVLGYAVRNGEYHAFADEIAHLVRDNEQVSATIFYEQPAVEDEQAGRFDRAGRIDAAWLQDQVSLDAEVYLCGPRGFMQGILTTLLKQGLKPEQLHYEIFGPALAFAVSQE
ncbi:flavohemoprotein [Ktedonobacter sp. SOSP1-52]|uniref:NO-inducible flavohemoprotein n=1 Tax=Ktedonobacter sp. SOSP1-52 TaxID=2778366 RepID=UPI001916266B|nr:NO-inducible flavohemoprotein [Ktedonobacter sp. SOSP1-52]GHO61839.1 flavohemoprotein [Ktedonobacter sp. SOSP1-52]